MTYRLAGEHDGQVIRLLIACGESVLGSAGDCALILSLPTVSRRHARLTFADGRLTVEDLDSSNGSRVNGQRLEAATAVKAGDCLQFGDVVLNVESVAEGDDQLGARLDPGETRAAAAEAGLTLAPMALDRLALDHLPQLLTEIGAGLDLPELARQTGEKLWRALPLQWLRITASGAGDPVLFVNGQPQEGQTISRQLGRVGVELAFEQAGLPARAERVFDLIAALLALARDTGHTADRAPKTPPGLPDPAPLDAEMQRIYRRAARAAGSGISVLIRGESGTGKELMARYLHRLSDPDAPFVAINCAALPTDLLESELFGIERGVATGVEERPGCFEQAHGGILFLDEIGDMAAETQARILRVLQEGEVLRVGGSKPRPARPRIISATNRNIEQMVERGLFRIDLLHRIAGWELTLPPLRGGTATSPILPCISWASTVANAISGYAASRSGRWPACCAITGRAMCANCSRKCIGLRFFSVTATCSPARTCARPFATPITPKPAPPWKPAWPWPSARSSARPWPKPKAT